MFRLFRFFLLCALLSTLTACGPVVSPQQQANLESPARSFEAQGNFAGAAAAWSQAASTVADAELAMTYRLNAADALVRAGDANGALVLVNSIPGPLSGDLATRRALIGADIALLEGNAASALDQLSPAIRTNDGALLNRYRATRAEALLLAGDTLSSARELALLESELDSPQSTYVNRQRIWERVSTLSNEQLTLEAFIPNDPFSGWRELASLAYLHGADPDALDSAIAEWNLRYPAHPAGEQIVPELLEQVRAESTPPSKVALLLPESGDFAGAAEAVRDGFMAAWFADAPNPQRPQVIVRDTGAGDALAVYHSALAEGAQFVIGPLTRDAVSQLLGAGEAPVTTITLNYPLTPIAEEPTAKLFFFALSPEDEAERAAEFARSRGAANAGVLVPAGDWGERIADAFSRRWNALGGQVAVRDAFSEEPTALSDTISRMLNIEQSVERMKAVRAAVSRQLEFAPQPRSDLDVLFVAAFPLEARQVLPLMQFHRAGNVPIVATSHLFTGNPSEGPDPDLEGVIFGDMPWLITPDIYGLPDEVKNAQPDSRGVLARLYAFGADAYALIRQLPRLRRANAEPYPGLSGNLSLGADHRIKRDLQWARFQEGKPVVLSGNP